ncbi:MAG: hypothetical protein H6708_28835 [Kofleriaceae bacterium]|nr:hypothetical protein [Myxococcales bacterium]MCB9564408.1 hypothetical protein [Kofleriaceae bacterium]
MRKFHATMRALALLGLATAAACGGDDDGGGTPQVPDATVATPDAVPVAVDAAPPDGAPAARVEATIGYDGAAEGTLLLAAFTSVPPSGGPIGFAQASSPTFPATLTLEDLAPQTLYVLAMLDVPPASPTQPGPEDLTVWSDALEVELGHTSTVTLTLVDP